MTTKCDYCGKEVYLPFVCKYCGGKFCAEHRLPESHNCPGLKKAKPPPGKRELLKVESKPKTGFSLFLKPISSLYSSFRGYNFSHSLLVLLTLILMEFVNLKTSMANEMIFAIFLPILIILVYIFIPEYFSRKINAELHFEVSALGLVFSILTSILPIKIIYFGDFIEGSTLFLSITGSIYFVQVFSLEVLYLVLAYLGKISVVAEYLSIISLYLAIFTLIPFWNSSGNKILRWNKWAYAVLVLTLILFFIGSNFIPSF